ncbi:hypothetical protein SISNIDRAFT_547182 [Sistotremastrum niveocremeum HHB9708]|uniref:Uncharacterized protein n=1 Tax=Sistotremastrum niveocremeum HHB9708 TaxID=1314777 RepID=A0A164YQ52_9AGAM|nr:hypothetical protein SISNIDRAFT_547182 [Sistotremastrum niveocremeum HHB9708]
MAVPNFVSNPVKTREDLAQFLTDLLNPLERHTSPGGALIHLGYTATHYDDHAAQLEGFSRPLWGLSSLLAGGGSYPGVERWVRGFANGTNPDHEEFWGNMRDRDQRMVECSAIGFSFAVAGKSIWDPLSEEAKANVEKWLAGMNDKEMPNTNWLWFRVFANLGLSKVGSKLYSKARLDADLDHLDTFYIKDGWSRDGPEGVVQLDYYSSSFAIQFAQLVYSKLAATEDPERSKRYRDRATRFAQDFVHYFDVEGRAIPFGRSNTYRFAQSSFWGALAFADVDLPAPLTWGIVKGLQLRNVRYWAKQASAYSPDGLATIGYNYPNLNMTDYYNSPGSPYWCCKSFVTLSLPPTHPFWASPEEPYPTAALTLYKPLPLPLHIISSTPSHSFLLNSGQMCSYALKHSAAKYGKFAYSSSFGFSVPTGSGSLEEAAADSALAVIETVDAGEGYRVRRVVEEARIETSTDGKNIPWLRSKWHPWKDTEIETWLVPPHPETPLWHLRIHRISTPREITTAEGAFALYGQGRDGRALDQFNASIPEGNIQEPGKALAISKAGAVGIVDLSPGQNQRKGVVVRSDPNSSLVFPRAVIPTLMDEIKGSADAIHEKWIVTAVFALPTIEVQAVVGKEWEEAWKSHPVVPEEIANLIRPKV